LLFKDRGWSAIVNDSLIEDALSMGGFVSGLVVGVVGWLYGSGSGLDRDSTLLLSLLGVACG
jgi:hypothetical protein